MSEEIKEVKEQESANMDAEANESKVDAPKADAPKANEKKSRKKSRKSWKLGCFFVFLILFVGGMIALTYAVDISIKKAVETMGPKFTKCKVTVGRVETRLFRGSFKMDDFVFGNPDGFKTQSAASIGSIYVKVDMKSIFSDKIIIEEILIDEPRFTYELKGMTSNVAVIQKNVDECLPKSTPEEQEAARRLKEEELARKKAAAEARGEEYVEPKGKSVQINLVKVTNGKVGFSMGMLAGKQAKMPVPDITLRDIGKDKKTSFTEAAASVVSQTLDSIMVVSKDSLGSAADATSDALEGLGKKTSSGLKRVDGSMQNFLDKMRGKKKQNE